MIQELQRAKRQFSSTDRKHNTDLSLETGTGVREKKEQDSTKNVIDWSLIIRHQKSFLLHWATDLNQQEHATYWATFKVSASTKTWVEVSIVPSLWWRKGKRSRLALGRWLTGWSYSHRWGETQHCTSIIHLLSMPLIHAVLWGGGAAGASPSPDTGEGERHSWTSQSELEFKVACLLVCILVSMSDGNQKLLMTTEVALSEARSSRMALDRCV